MFRERLYGYGVGVAAGVATIGAVAYPDLTPWLVLLVVLVWAARRRVTAAPESECHTNEYGEVWHE